MPSTELEHARTMGSSAGGSRLRQAALNATLRMGNWRASVVFALFDQGMTSFANFAQFTIAARLLPINEFGIYSLAWVSSMLVVFGASGLIVDPLPAIASIRRPSIRRALLAAAARLSVFMGGALAALMAIGGLIAWHWSPALGTLLLCLAVASPLQQLQIASRRFCYLLRRESVAAASAAAYATVLIGGVVALWATALCSVHTFILLSGVASLAALAVACAKGCVPVSKVRGQLWKWLMRQCWHSGKWLTAASVTLSMSNFFILWITAVMFGASASGILRAVSMLFMPMFQFTSAMGSLLVPRIADIGASQSARRLQTAALLTIAALGATAAAYSLVVLILGKDLFVLVYNKPDVAGVLDWLWLFATCAILEAVTSATALVLMANGITRFNFWSRFASLAVLVSGTVSLGMVIGFNGIMWAAIAGSALSAFLHGLALVRFLQRRRRSGG